MGALRYSEPVCRDIQDRHWLLLHNGEHIFCENSQQEDKGLEGSICTNIFTRMIALILSYTDSYRVFYFNVDQDSESKQICILVTKDVYEKCLNSLNSEVVVTAEVEDRYAVIAPPIKIESDDFNWSFKPAPHSS